MKKPPPITNDEPLPWWFYAATVIVFLAICYGGYVARRELYIKWTEEGVRRALAAEHPTP